MVLIEFANQVDSGGWSNAFFFRVKIFSFKILMTKNNVKFKN